MLKNTRTAWGSAAKLFHWLIAFLILAIVPAGFLMSQTYVISLRDRDALAVHNFAGQIHHTLGFLILLLVISRLIWRLLSVTPAPVQPQRWQRWLANLVHATLYGLLLLLPLTGWAALSVYRGAPVWLFNINGAIPPILPELPLDNAFGYGFFAHLHQWAAIVGGGILTTHVLAALWHHWVRRDTTLLRMWPLGRAQRTLSSNQS